MGHRLGKIPIDGCNASKFDSKSQYRLNSSPKSTESSKIEEPIISAQTLPCSAENEKLNLNFVEALSTQIIIKIQLTKMEGQHVTNNHCNESTNDTNAASPTNNNVLNDFTVNFNGNLSCDEQKVSPTANIETLTQISKISRVTNEGDTASIPDFFVNNNFTPNVVVTPTSAETLTSENFNVLIGPMTDLQMDEKRTSMTSLLSTETSNSKVAAYNTSENASEPQAAKKTTVGPSNCQRSIYHPSEEADVDNIEYCCRRKSKSTTFPSKWRCCKCTCRDALKRILDASTSKSIKKKERKDSSSSKAKHHSSDHLVMWNPVQQNSPQLSSSARRLASMTAPSGAISSGVASTIHEGASPMSIWSPTTNDVIIPISSPQFVVVQCPPSSLVTLGRIDDNAIRLMATELVPTASNASTTARILSSSAALVTTPTNCSASTTSSTTTPNLCFPIASGPVVHSQVDYIHCLVPDLEEITKASFYWGKMDRYEAERLLEGKPEGTFLLRDSAQEEYLFSVTFRKYGRSLHARIEQSNHKFSFDCHDPCVFTAPTVTGLLEHYKDPTCVMFFEPMLTIPLHRSTTFSLQQLCRATIVSNITYDGINELELPSRLKSYLKEYHYKQKLRVKPYDEPFYYSCT